MASISVQTKAARKWLVGPPNLQPPTEGQRYLTAFAGCPLHRCIQIFLIACRFEIATKAVPPKGCTGFIVGNYWDPNKAQYGILPEIWGTLYNCC
jgi:ABC-type phosphate transport system permease subunit